MPMGEGRFQKIFGRPIEDDMNDHLSSADQDGEDKHGFFEMEDKRQTFLHNSSEVSRNL
jgi:hypothetical protein